MDVPFKDKEFELKKMPWVKQFDVDESLEKAKELFWLKGFEATSMQELLSVMGINRGSFYDTFGSKNEVYLKVLKRYDEQSREAMFKLARKIKSPKEAILFIFNETIEYVTGPKGYFGCLLANSVSEVAPHNEEAKKICNDAFQSTRNFLKMLIEEGIKAGEIRNDTDSEDLASTLFSLLLGLKVLARSSPERSVVEATRKQVEFLLS
jgi:TetR/AcrR family transcriptional repressor of nem operon